MKMIYAVFTGKYSDWDVKCYFKTEEEAEQYCYYHNQDSNAVCWDRHYVVAIPFGNQEFPKTKLYKHYQIHIDLSRDKLNVERVRHWEGEVNWHNEIKHTTLRNGPSFKYVSLVVSDIYTSNVEVAKKIAQDVVTEFKYLVEVDGLSIKEAIECINEG